MISPLPRATCSRGSFFVCGRVRKTGKQAPHPRREGHWNPCVRVFVRKSTRAREKSRSRFCMCMCVCVRVRRTGKRESRKHWQSGKSSRAGIRPKRPTFFGRILSSGVFSLFFGSSAECAAGRRFAPAFVPPSGSGVPSPAAARSALPDVPHPAAAPPGRSLRFTGSVAQLSRVSRTCVTNASISRFTSSGASVLAL